MDYEVFSEMWSAKYKCEELLMMDSQPQRLCRADKAASLLVLVITVFTTLSCISSYQPYCRTISLVQATLRNQVELVN